MIHKEIEAGEVRLNHLLDRSDRDLGLGDIVSIRNHPGSPDGATPPQVTITALFEDGMTRAWSYGPTEIVKVAIPE